jgi:hypothetical protein
MIYSEHQTSFRPDSQLMEALPIHLLRNNRWPSLPWTEDHLATMNPRCPASYKTILRRLWTVPRRFRTWKA